MSTAGTLSIAVRLALVAALKADTDFERCDVSYQFNEVPAPDRDASVWTRSSRFSQESAGMRAGRHYRDETGRFELVIAALRVDRIDVTVAAASDVAGGLAAWISDRKNNELDVPGLQALVIDGDGSVLEMKADQGRTFCEITLPIRYTARLT